MSRGVAGVSRGWQRLVKGLEGVRKGREASGGISAGVIGRRQPLRLSTANAACSFNSY